MTDSARPARVPTPLHAQPAFQHQVDPFVFPEQGMEPDAAYELLHTGAEGRRPAVDEPGLVRHHLDGARGREAHPRGDGTNHIDHEEYPIAEHAEQICVRMLADLWHAPDLAGPSAWPPSARPRRSCSGCSPTSSAGATAARPRACPPTRPTSCSAPRPTSCGTSSPATSMWSPARSRCGPTTSCCTPTTWPADRREHDRRRRGAGHHLHRRERPHLRAQRPARGDQGREGLGHPAARRRGQRRLHRPLRPPRRAVGLPPRAGGVDQRIGPQVRPRVPGCRLAGVPRPRQLPDDLVFNVNYLGGAQPTFTFNFSRAGDDPGAVLPVRPPGPGAATTPSSTTC